MRDRRIALSKSSPVLGSMKDECYSNALSKLPGRGIAVRSGIVFHAAVL